MISLEETPGDISREALEERQRAMKIQILNDSFRKSLTGGDIFMTSGIEALGFEQTAQILGKVRKFDKFDEENDPYGEHDFGSFSYNGQKIFWKIDYFDHELKMHSEDPTDPTSGQRMYRWRASLVTQR